MARGMLTSCLLRLEAVKDVAQIATHECVRLEPHEAPRPLRVRRDVDGNGLWDFPRLADRRSAMLVKPQFTAARRL